MLDHPCRSCGRRRALAAVELAVLLPLLAFLLVLAVDFARVFYTTLTITTCARNGAVYASNIANYPGWQGSQGQIAGIQQAAVADGAGLNPPLATDQVTVTTGTQNGNPVVNVTVSYTFHTITNFPGIPAVTIERSSKQTRVAPAAPN